MIELDFDEGLTLGRGREHATGFGPLSLVVGRGLMGAGARQGVLADGPDFLRRSCGAKESPGRFQESDASV